MNKVDGQDAVGGAPGPERHAGSTVGTAGGSSRVRPGERRWRGHIGKIIALATVLLSWHLTYVLWLPDYAPSPAGVAAEILPTLSGGAFASALSATVTAVLGSLIVGCGLGTVVGLIIGRMAPLRAFVSPYVGGLYAMPMIALVPMLTIWLGYSGRTRLVVVALSAALPCVVSASDGVRSLPSELVDVAHVLRVPRRRFLTDIVMPSTLPFIVAGIQVAIGRALVGAVAVEILANLNGIGTFILSEARAFRQNDAFVAVLILALLGIFARQGISVVFRFVAPWETRRG